MTVKYDTVILAAGKGERLNGITPSFYKPLLVMNGQPLVQQAALHGLEFGDVTVVSSPENTAPMTQVLPREVQMIVQREPLGPGRALLEGLKLTTTKHVIVLMGDNILSHEDVFTIAGTDANNVIGIESYRGANVERFTYYNGEEWVEKVSARSDASYKAWVGPLKLNREEITKAITDFRPYSLTGDGHQHEVPIGPLFNFLTGVETVNVTSVDIGTPEMLG